MRLLIAGATGMLGSTLTRRLGAEGFEVHASVRLTGALPGDPAAWARVTVHQGIDLTDAGAVQALLLRVRPQVVVNCAGLVKQLDAASDPEQAVRLNALLPHQLARLCAGQGCRLIHFSTDCVFSGARGLYTEQDLPDARDLYGRSKCLGEVSQGGHLTLRTSIIGHELATHHGLVEWFRRAAAQPGAVVRGYRRAVFSGLPTVEVARVLARHVLPAPELQGLYHLAVEPIDKHALLGLLAKSYGLSPRLVEDDEVVIDRSLDASAFRAATGYRPPAWPDLVTAMHDDFAHP